MKIARVKWLCCYRWTQPFMENENALYRGSYEAGLYREECPLLVGLFYVNEELQIQTVRLAQIALSLLVGTELL